MTHTPGPWKLCPPNDWYPGSGYGVQAKTPEGPGFPTPSATGYYAIACPPPHGKDKAEEQQSNARLIAAAPEMLEALQQSLEFVIAWRFEYADKPNDKHNNMQRDRIDAALKAIQNAIKKATNDS